MNPYVSAGLGWANALTIDAGGDIPMSMHPAFKDYYPSDFVGPTMFDPNDNASIEQFIVNHPDLANQIVSNYVANPLPYEQSMQSNSENTSNFTTDFDKLGESIENGDTSSILSGSASILDDNVQLGYNNSSYAYDQYVESLENSQKFFARQNSINRMYNAKEAVKAWDRYEQSADNAYQRSREYRKTAMSDTIDGMLQRGVNPILAINQGAISTPMSGASMGHSATSNSAPGLNATGFMPNSSLDGLLDVVTTGMNTASKLYDTQTDALSNIISNLTDIGQTALWTYINSMSFKK